MSQTGFQSTAKKYSLNIEFIKLRLLMGGIPKDKANLAAEKEVEETIARDESNDKLERSTLALITLILAAVGLILAFIAYAVQGRSLLLGAQVLFVAGALLLSIQISKQFPLINPMMEVQERGMREAIAGAHAAENEAAKVIKEQEKKDEEKGEEEGESEAEKGDEDVVGNDEGEAPDSEGEESLAEGEEEGAAENKEEKIAKKAEVSNAQKEKEIAKPMEEFSGAFQSKVEASCYVVVVLLGLSLLLLIIMMSMSKAPPAAVPQLGATTAQPQVGGFRLQ